MAIVKELRAIIDYINHPYAQSSATVNIKRSYFKKIFTSSRWYGIMTKVDITTFKKDEYIFEVDTEKTIDYYKTL